MSPDTTKKRWLSLFLMFAVVAAAAAGLSAYVLTSVMEHKQEAKNPFFRVVEITDDTGDPAIWGKNFPLQYDRYLRTADMVRTRRGGSEALPHTPTDADPRSIVSQSKIEEDTRLKRMWAGYAFSKDFREERGHAYMLEDQLYTERQKVGQPGTCLNCHASTYLIYKELGNGDIMAGFDKMNSMKYDEAKTYAKHPVACIDCHDAQTMQLRITRPAFIEGIKALKASQGVADYDVNTMATRQEMRSFVCGQCHVEYYFKGDKKRLTFPWHNGVGAEDILDYYNEQGFKDWVHADTGAPMLKAQHPELEMWNKGVHAQAGVACADCHMPYMREGAMKISDHHVRSPLLNINKSCGTCHRVSEEELKARAENIQETFFGLRNQAMDSLMDLIDDLKAAKDAGRPDAELAAARELQRRASFLIDFCEAENSTGFHAPQESTRLLGVAINYARDGQLSVRDPNYKPKTIAAHEAALAAKAAATPAAAPDAKKAEGQTVANDKPNSANTL